MEKSESSSKLRKGSLKKTPFTKSSDLSHSKNVDQCDLKEPAWKCRYVIVLMGFVVFLFATIQRTLMSILIVAMVNNTAIDQQSEEKGESCLNLISNSTKDDTTQVFESRGELMWSPEIQAYIFGSYYLGCVVSQMPAGRLGERYGCKWFIVLTLLMTGILTILIPPVSWWSVYAVIVLQTVRGLAQGLSIPCVTTLIANWSPKKERGFMFGIVLSSFSLGPVVGNLFAGYVSESPAGWPCAYYAIGGLGLVLAFLVVIFVAENPNEHHRITEAERNFILSNQEFNLSQKRPNLPWRQVLTSVPVYALILVIFGRGWALSQFWIVHSTFLGTILHYPMGQNGLFTALPNLVSFFVSQIASCASLYIEKKNIVTVNFLRKFWTLVYGIGYSLSLFGMYIVGCDRNLSVIFSILSMGFTGFGIAGCSIVAQDMSPKFAGTLLSICAFTGYIANVLFPLLVGYLTDEMRTLEQWNKVFFVCIAVVMSSTLTFLFFGSTKVQAWNFLEDEKEMKKEATVENKPEKKCDEITRF